MISSFLASVNFSGSFFGRFFSDFIVSTVMMKEESRSSDFSSVIYVFCKNEMNSESVIPRSDGYKEMAWPSSYSRSLGVGGEFSDEQKSLRICSVGLGARGGVGSTCCWMSYLRSSMESLS